jgi:hypothetical protein
MKVFRGCHFREGSCVIPLRKSHSLLAAKQPPVMNPEMIAFHASSFCRHPFTAQSNVENIPPQTPKFPPVTGARAFIEEIAPMSRSPLFMMDVSLDCDKIYFTTHSWRITSTFYTIPNTTANCAHRKCASKIVKNDPGTVTTRSKLEIAVHM